MMANVFFIIKLKNAVVNDGEVLTIPLSARITKRGLFILKEIVQAEGEIKKKKLADLDEILFDLLTPEVVHQWEESSAVLDFLQILNKINIHPQDWAQFLFISFISFLLLQLYQRKSFTYIILSSLILFVGVSWYWHW